LILFHVGTKGNRDLQQCYLAREKYDTCMTTCTRRTCILSIK
jgi:hypothetical protein